MAKSCDDVMNVSKQETGKVLADQDWTDFDDGLLYPPVFVHLKECSYCAPNEIKKLLHKTHTSSFFR